MKSVLDVNLDDILKQEPLVLLEFHSPHCAHCKALTPSLEKLATQYSEQIELIAVDIFEAGNVAERYNVLSVPTILFLKKGELKDKVIGSTYYEIIEDKIKKYY